jgi:hypothetical protein
MGVEGKYKQWILGGSFSNQFSNNNVYFWYCFLAAFIADLYEE